MRYLNYIKNNIFNKQSINLKLRNVNSNLDRSDFDNTSKRTIEYLLDRKKKLPSISAIYRVKNGSSSLELSILSVAAICTEIIIIDNLSTDNTREIVKKLQFELKDICSIKLFTFDKKVTVAGNNYSKKLNKNEATLSEFYNECFHKGNCDYLMKVDSHLIFSVRGLFEIQKKLSILPRFIIYRGVEAFGKKMSFEFYLFKNDTSFTFLDGKFYEKLTFSYKINFFEKFKNTIFEPVYIHVKRLTYLKLPVKSNIAEYLYK